MATDRTAVEVKTRFSEEQVYIQRYTEFVMRELYLGMFQIHLTGEQLRAFGIPCVIIRDRKQEGAQDANIQAIESGLVILNQKIQDEQKKLDQDFPGEDLSSLMSRQPKHLNYIERRFGDRLLIEDKESIAKDCLTKLNKKKGEGFETIETMTEIVKEIVGRRRAGHLSALQLCKNGCDIIALMARGVRSDSEINVLRQSFILLMTAFDAAIFDLVRVALNRRFFQLAKAFGDEEQYNVENIAEFGSFEALQENIIEKELKNRFIKELLYLLNRDWKVECVDTGDKFVRLIEFVLRRNLHIHNRGVVDKRYLDFNLNLDRLVVGKVAIIDEGYWKMANRMCKTCVDRVAAWADA